MKLRVVSYNIRGGRGLDGRRDYERIGELLKEQNVDVALIQGLNTRPHREDTELAVSYLSADHFPHFIAVPTTVNKAGWYGKAIFSRYPILQRNVIDTSIPGGESHNILEAYLETPQGLLHVVNTHKGLQRAERAAQLAKLNDLLSVARDVPLIVGGDLNEWQTSSRALKKLHETLHVLDTGPTFPTSFPMLKLDRMLCRPEKIFSSVRILKNRRTRFYSDHYPLCAEIEI